MSKSDRIQRILTANIGAKIISVLFATFLWLHVTAQQEEKQSFRVPLQLTNIPDSLTVIHGVPEFAEVTIGGSRSTLLKLRLLGKLRASVDLSTAKRGRMNFQLSPANLNIPKDLDPRDITIDNPKALGLNFERMISKSVPVRIAYKGEIPKDVIIVGTPVILPDRVTVTGAASIVSGIDFLNTEEFDIRNRDGKLTQETDLSLGGDNVSVTPPKVLVEIDLSKRVVHTLPNIPPTILHDDRALTVDYFPKVATLTIEGPEEIIKNIVAEEVSIILNITTKGAGSYMIEPEIIVPQGIERYWLDIDSFEVVIEPRAPESTVDEEAQ